MNRIADRRVIGLGLAVGLAVGGVVPAAAAPPITSKSKLPTSIVEGYQNPCQPIPVAFDPKEMPAGTEHLAHLAVQEAKQVSGLPLVWEAEDTKSTTRSGIVFEAVKKLPEGFTEFGREFYDQGEPYYGVAGPAGPDINFVGPANGSGIDRSIAFLSLAKFPSYLRKRVPGRRGSQGYSVLLHVLGLALGLGEPPDQHQVLSTNGLGAYTH